MEHVTYISYQRWKTAGRRRRHEAQDRISSDGAAYRLVRSLAGFMALAILMMGLIGRLCAAFTTIFSKYVTLLALGFDTPLGLTALFVWVDVFALCGAFCGTPGRLQPPHRLQAAVSHPG